MSISRMKEFNNWEKFTIKWRDMKIVKFKSILDPVFSSFRCPKLNSKE